MLHIGICDDEQGICNAIEKTLRVISSNLLVEVDIEVFSSGTELYGYLENGANLDILFLDIMMEGVDGIQIGKKIRDKLHNESIKIIYISSQESYAMELFDVRPLNFLIKPIQIEKLEAVFTKAVKLIKKENEFFEYSISNAVYKVRTKEILYFESSGKKIRMITQDEVEEFYGKLSDVKKQIDKQNFISIHKSYLINYDHVIQYHYECMKMSNKVSLPISKTNRKTVRDTIMKLRDKENQNGI